VSDRAFEIWFWRETRMRVSSGFPSVGNERSAFGGGRETHRDAEQTREARKTREDAVHRGTPVRGSLAVRRVTTGPGAHALLTSPMMMTRLRRFPRFADSKSFHLRRAGLARLNPRERKKTESARLRETRNMIVFVRGSLPNADVKRVCT
jgi:hypothetical protein